MKQISFIALTLLIGLLLSLNVSATNVNSINIATGEWPPYLSEKLPYQGVAALLIEEAFLQQNIKTHFSFYSWKRAYDQAKAGRWEATAVWRKTKEREQYFYFSDVILETENVFFHRTDYPFTWSSVDDLKGHSVGITRSYSYDDKFTKAYKEGRFHAEVADSDTINIRKLLNHRIDILPMEKFVGFAILNQAFSSEQKKLITFNKKPLTQNKQRVLFSKKWPDALELMRHFNDGLATLKSSGRYQEIIDDYNNGRLSGTVEK